MNEDRKSNRRQNLNKKKDKKKKFLDEEHIYHNKINKQFKIKKQQQNTYIDESEDNLYWDYNK